MDDIKKAAKTELDAKNVIRNQNVAKISEELVRSGKLINEVVGDAEKFTPSSAQKQNPVAVPTNGGQAFQPVQKTKVGSKMPIFPILVSFIAIFCALGIGVFSYLQLETLQSEITTLNKSAKNSEKNPAELSANKGSYTNLSAGTATIETLSAKNITATESITFPSGGTPSIAALPGACANPTLAVTGDDTSGSISIKTGSNCSGSALATISFSESSKNLTSVTVTPASESAGAQHFYVNKAEKSFDILLNNTTKANTTYLYNYSTTR